MSIRSLDNVFVSCWSPLRPAGGDPGIDRQQKYFFDGLCFFEWTWPFWTPLTAFDEEAVWFKHQKPRRKVAPFLTPLGAARAALSADWLIIDRWENPSFGSTQLVGTLRSLCTLLWLALQLTFESRLSLLCMHIVGHATESEVHASGKFYSISDPPSPSLSLSFSFSLSLSLSLSVWPDSRKRITSAKHRASERKFAQCSHQVQVSRAPTAGGWFKRKNAELFACNVKLCFVNFERPRTQKQNSDRVWVGLAALGSCQRTLTMSLDNVYLLVDDSTFASTNNKYLEDSLANRLDLRWSAAPALQ